MAENEMSGVVEVTPLTLHEWSGLKPSEIGKYWEIRGGQGLKVDYGNGSELYGFNISGWLPKEAAEFIVRAGNSHAQLVEALEPLARLARLYRDFDFAPDFRDMSQLGEFISVAHVRRAVAALAKARGTPSSVSETDSPSASTDTSASAP